MRPDFLRNEARIFLSECRISSRLKMVFFNLRSISRSWTRSTWNAAKKHIVFSWDGSARNVCLVRHHDAPPVARGTTSREPAQRLRKSLRGARANLCAGLNHRRPQASTLWTCDFLFQSEYLRGLNQKRAHLKRASWPKASCDVSILRKAIKQDARCKTRQMMEFEMAKGKADA